MGMDCLNFVFTYTNLGPMNIIVEDKPNLGKVGIINFKIAGYFPQSWIRTKFWIFSRIDLSPSVTNDPHWWRVEVQKALGANGFDNVQKAWEEWQGTWFKNRLTENFLLLLHLHVMSVCIL
jgi:hypothetical protein